MTPLVAVAGQVLLWLSPPALTPGAPITVSGDLSAWPVTFSQCVRTVEEVGLTDGPTNARPIRKWLRTVERVRECGQPVYVEWRPPVGVVAGIYRGQVRAGKTVWPVEVRVADLDLPPPLSFGLTLYDCHEDTLATDLALSKSIGMTTAFLAPIHWGSTVPIVDEVADWSLYDRILKQYADAGLTGPPIVMMDGLWDSLGHNEARMRKVIRQLYEHSQVAKWPDGWYAYFSDEPQINTDAMTKAVAMNRVAREVAPELRLAVTCYTLEGCKQLEGLYDLNIAHYVHPTANPDANVRWRLECPDLWGIDWIGQYDTLEQTRDMIGKVTRYGLDGMICWAQWLHAWLPAKQSTLYAHHWATRTWKGGPMLLMEECTGRELYRSLPWLGIREGLIDSRFYKAALRMDPETANAAKTREEWTRIAERSRPTQR